MRERKHFGREMEDRERRLGAVHVNYHSKVGASPI